SRTPGRKSNWSPNECRNRVRVRRATEVPIMSALAFPPALDDRTDNGRTKVLDELEGRVQDELIGRVRDFRLMMGEGGLVLVGRTSTYYAKQLAQEAVMRATNLPIVANEIDVY